MKINLAMALLAITLLSTNAMALTQKINIQLNATHLRGMDEVPLSKMIVRKIGRQAKLDKAVGRMEILTQGNIKLDDVDVLL